MRRYIDIQSLGDFNGVCGASGNTGFALLAEHLVNYCFALYQVEGTVGAHLQANATTVAAL